MARLVNFVFVVGQWLACHSAAIRSRGRYWCDLPTMLDRVESKMRRPLGMLPTGFTSAPFQVAVHGIAVYRGLSYVTGIVPISTGQEEIVEPIPPLILGGLGIGGLIALIGVLWWHGPKVPVERLGLLLVSPMSFAYAMLALSSQPAKGSLAFVIYTLIAIAAALRLWQIRLQRQLLEAAFEQHRVGGAG